MSQHDTKSQKINQLCHNLYKSSFFINDIIKMDTTSIINKIFYILHNSNNLSYFITNDMEIMKISTIFLSLGNLLNATTLIYTSEKNTDGKTIQDYKKITIKDYFDMMNQNNNLFTHSHLCCLIALLFVIRDKPNLSNLDYMKFATIAYLHNIGKLNTIEFSGELGAGLLLQLWNTTFGEPFTKEIWSEICRTICVYGSNMSVYETNRVKENLYYLSLGDEFANLKNQHDFTNLSLGDEFANLNNQHNFNNIVNLKKSIIKPFNKINYKFVIIVRGISNVGKTTCVNKINSFLNNNEFETKIVHNNNFQLKDIQYGFLNNEIIIIETDLLNYIELVKNITSMIPNIFIISVDVIRNIPFIGNSIEHTKSIISWVPNIVKYEDLKSNMCFIIAHNNNCEIGYDELFELFESLKKI